MKSVSKYLLLFVMLATASFSFAEATYPVTNPTYTPAARSPAATYTAPGSYVFTLNNVNTLSLRVSGTCTSLAAVAQVSVDGTNYVTTNLYPVVTGVVTVATAVGAAGTWRVNTSGMSKFRLSITALTASCTVQAVGSPAAFTATM